MLLRPLFCWFVAPLSAAALVSMSTDVAAHGLPPMGIYVSVEDGALEGGLATYGFVVETPDGPRWISEESNPGVEPTGYRWLHASGDRLYAAGHLGLFRSADSGCSWTEVTEFSNRVVAAKTVDPSSPDRILVVTADEDATNELFESLDGGETWASLASSPHQLTTVETVGGDGTVLVTSRSIDGEGAVLRYDSMGVLVDFYLPSAVDAELTLIGRDLADRALVSESTGFLGLGAESTLVALAADTTSEALAVFDSRPVSAYAEVGDVRLVAVNFARHYRSIAGEAFEEIYGPARCLDMWSDPGTIWGCGLLVDQATYLSSTDGIQWTKHMPFDDVCPYVCPEGTAGAAAVEVEWPLVQASGVGFCCERDCMPRADPAPMEGLENDRAEVDDLASGTDATDTSGPRDGDLGSTNLPDRTGNDPAIGGGGCACRTNVPSSPVPATIWGCAFALLILRSRFT